jgi:hypothetical protein
LFSTRIQRHLSVLQQQQRRILPRKLRERDNNWWSCGTWLLLYDLEQYKQRFCIHDDCEHDCRYNNDWKSWHGSEHGFEYCWGAKHSHDSSTEQYRE